jgi:hypothetical protein
MTRALSLPSRRAVALASFLLLASFGAVGRAQDATPPATDPAAAEAAARDAAAAAASRDAAHAAAIDDAAIAKRNAELEQSLSGATLVGQFTVNGGGDVRPSAERYELVSVKHIEGDMWLITARIKYGPHDVTVPLPLPIRWAGDTPVITLDDFSVPGLGSYSARVMIYDDRYMGYWSAKDHGGYLFGAVEKPGEKPAAAPTQNSAGPAEGAAAPPAAPAK